MSQSIEPRNVLILFSILMATLSPADKVSAAPDIPGPDLIIDAPWRTTRDYLPVMFFAAEFDSSQFLKVNSLRLSNYDPFSEQQQTIFVDSRDTEDDQFDCEISFIDPEGEARSHFTETEVVDSFWHYIARVPVSCITGFRPSRSTPGEYFLRGEIKWSLAGVENTAFHVLRVIVTPDSFAKFSPVDHLFDVHVHTVAEQTAWHGISNPQAGKKAYGGPLAMLMESAYALGMVDVQLRNGNWSDYRNKIITTDHNAFFSGPPYDAGTAPGYGPTSHHHTNGKDGEFNWYREHLGELGGEEITVQGANGHQLEGIDISADNWRINISAKNLLGLGSHLLSYGAPHFEGPWHGGFLRQLPNQAPNPISISHAISEMGSSNGFGYAAHPESSLIGWSEDYYEQAIGLYPHNRGSASSPILQKNQREFVFKGLQVWNGHGDMASRKSGQLEFDEVHRFDPHTKSSRDQQFVPNPEWRDDHDKTYETYKRLLRRGLEYSFDDDNRHKFIRKLYLSAGTDSHAAFNDDVDILASQLAEFKGLVTNIPAVALANELFDNVGASANNNAFGRMRTYTLTSQRYIRAGASIPRDCEAYPFCDGVHSAPSNFPLEDYKEGNTVATDGPVGRFSTDANCRFNSDIHKLSWHDDLCVWENHDGMIGGRGKFDGGNTMLAPVGNVGVMMRYDWIGKNDYRPDSESGNSTMLFNLVRINSKHIDADNGEFPPGRSGRPNTAHINEVLEKPNFIQFPHKAALILEGELSKSPEEVLNDPANIWFPRETLRKDGKVVDPYLTKFVTNPIWIAPYKISVNPVRACPIEPGQLRVTVEFAISMDTTLPKGNLTANQVASVPMMKQVSDRRYTHATQRSSVRSSVESRLDREAHSLPGTAVADEKTYDGIRVVVKPLDQRGNSNDVHYEISNQNSRWQAVEIPRGRPQVADAKYTTTNTMTIPCGAGWNAESPKQKHDQRFASYAIVVDQIYDMHMNYLNPVARAISTARPSSPFDPLIDVGTENDQVLEPEKQGPEKKSCSARDRRTCGDFGAECEVVEATGGSETGLCRWPAANNANKCGNTVGLWTTAQSKYARNHPGAVATGAAGACITEAKNLRNRIQ